MRNKQNIDFSVLSYGKVPPQAKSLEDIIIGAMMLEAKVVPEIKAILKPEDFYVDANKIVYSAICRISETSSPDTMLVIDELQRVGKLDDIGGFYQIMEYTKKVESIANVVKYCGIVKQKSVARKLIEFGGVVLSKGFEDTEDVFDILNEADEKLKGINFELDELKITSVGNIAMNVLDQLHHRVHCARNNIVNENDVFTGIEEWDKINGSLFPGVYTVAGRPGMGKGVHLTELVVRMGKRYPVGVLNGEMSNEQLLIRLGCNLMSIDNQLWKKPATEITDEELGLVEEAMNKALDLKLHLCDQKRMDKIKNKVRMWVKKDGVKVIFADFLTLFKVPEEMENRLVTDVQKLNYIMDAFASLAKELKVPIILYVQMNREVLKRNGVKEPNLGDLKGSGSIDELSYQISFLHRPEYYDPNNLVDEFGESTKGLMYQIIAKHRDGEVGKLKFRALLQCSKLESWESEKLGRWIPMKDVPF